VRENLLTGTASRRFRRKEIEVLETGAITLSGSAEALARDPRIREAYLSG
jgi:ABC-type branched-subunit amino acid transport system ATPase component